MVDFAKELFVGNKKGETETARTGPKKSCGMEELKESFRKERIT